MLFNHCTWFVGNALNTSTFFYYLTITYYSFTCTADALSTLGSVHLFCFDFLLTCWLPCSLCCHFAVWVWTAPTYGLLLVDRKTVLVSQSVSGCKPNTTSSLLCCYLLLVEFWQSMFVHAQPLSVWFLSQLAGSFHVNIDQSSAMATLLSSMWSPLWVGFPFTILLWICTYSFSHVLYAAPPHDW